MNNIFASGEFLSCKADLLSTFDLTAVIFGVVLFD